MHFYIGFFTVKKIYIGLPVCSWVLCQRLKLCHRLLITWLGVASISIVDIFIMVFGFLTEFLENNDPQHLYKESSSFQIIRLKVYL